MNIWVNGLTNPIFCGIILKNEEVYMSYFVIGGRYCVKGHYADERNHSIVTCTFVCRDLYGDRVNFEIANRRGEKANVSSVHCEKPSIYDEIRNLTDDELEEFIALLPQYGYSKEKALYVLLSKKVFPCTGMEDVGTIKQYTDVWDALRNLWLRAHHITD